MDSERFDTLTRTLSSRRTALTGILGGLAAVVSLSFPNEVTAHNLVPACKKIKDAKKRRACLRRARAHRRQHKSQQRCVAVHPALTCAGRCGVWDNNCGQAVPCLACPAGRTCLVNGGCAQVCTGGTCPPSCAGCGFANTEGTRTCIALGSGCPTHACSSTVECPPGTQCHPCLPGGPTFCFPLCTA